MPKSQRGVVRPVAKAHCRQQDGIRWCLHQYHGTHSRTRLLRLECRDSGPSYQEWDLWLSATDPLFDQIPELFRQIPLSIFLRKSIEAIKAAALMRSSP